MNESVHILDDVVFVVVVFDVVVVVVVVIVVVIFVEVVVLVVVVVVVSEHRAVSVGSPTQAAAEGALLQFRNLNFLPLNQVGSHSDHSPHSAQVPAAPVENK